MSYYNIDDILTDSQKIPCTFELPVPKIGSVLETRSADDSKKTLQQTPARQDEGLVAKGTKSELPLWLCWMLAVSPNPQTGQGFVTLDFPDALGTPVLNALRANPQSVDVRSLATHFYSLGSRMLELFEEEELSIVLTEAFKLRTKEIADQAYNPKGALGEGAEFLRGLDETERKLFRVTHDSSKLVRQWLISSTRKQW